MKLEPLVKDFTYHIYNRGINGESIFINDENKRYFLQLMEKHLSLCCSVYAYCLMDNHFHLLISVKQEGEAATQQFSNLFNAYAKAFNKANDRTGSLFEKHFKRIKITDEEYVKQLVIYIHLNPKHHFDLDFTKFKYSSYQSFLSHKESKMERDYILKLFNDSENFAFAHFQKNKLIESMMLE